MYTKKHYEAAPENGVALKQFVAKNTNKKSTKHCEDGVGRWHMIHNEIKIYIFFLFYFVFYNHTKKNSKKLGVAVFFFILYGIHCV